MASTGSAGGSEGGPKIATFASFDDFWPFYLSQHRQRGCRILHYLGTSSAVAVALVALLSGHPRFLLLALLVGYAPAWIGHAAVEKNRPASFRYPFWSFYADFRMLARALRDRRI